MRRCLAVTEDLLGTADADETLLHPRRITLAGDEHPLAVGAFVQHGDRITGEQRRFLEAVDVGIALAAEHAQLGGEGAQRGAVYHQPVLHGAVGGNAGQRQVVADGLQLRSAHLLALHVVQGAGGGAGNGVDLFLHEGTRQVGRQRLQVVDGSVELAHARVLRVDAGAVQDHRIRVG
ncbi:hypothetical protein D3C71_1399670 [compost metagenome]